MSNSNIRDIQEYFENSPHLRYFYKISPTLSLDLAIKVEILGICPVYLTLCDNFPENRQLLSSIVLKVV